MLEWLSADSNVLIYWADFNTFIVEKYGKFKWRKQPLKLRGLLNHIYMVNELFLIIKWFITVSHNEARIITGPIKGLLTPYHWEFNILSQLLYIKSQSENGNSFNVINTWRHPNISVTPDSAFSFLSLHLTFTFSLNLGNGNLCFTLLNMKCLWLK